MIRDIFVTIALCAAMALWLIIVGCIITAVTIFNLPVIIFNKVRGMK